LEDNWDIIGLNMEEDVMKNKVIDRILGTIYGNALGDAVGLSTEFLFKKDIKTIYGNRSIEFPNFIRNAHNSRWEVGDWTDDTDQLILILETIVENNGEVDIKCFAKKLVHWIRYGFMELQDFAGMGLGATVSQTARNPNFLENPHESAKQTWMNLNQNAAANGAIMRTSILGCVNFNNFDVVSKNTIDICQVTHYDSRCVASCLAVTLSISKILQGSPVDTPENIRKLIDEIEELVLKLNFPSTEHIKEFKSCI